MINTFYKNYPKKLIIISLFLNFTLLMAKIIILFIKIKQKYSYLNKKNALKDQKIFLKFSKIILNFCTSYMGKIRVKLLKNWY